MAEIDEGRKGVRRRVIHLDAIGGIAGDMFVAAMLDAFPGLVDRVLGDASAVLPPEIDRPGVSEGTSAGLRALRFGPEPRADAPAHAHHADLVRRIEAADLQTGTAHEALAILDILARAEARVHGIDVDHVHFHEVGGWDSLADVVAAGSIAAALKDHAWSVSPLPRGSGTVRTAHGLLPVPAPATVEILAGFAWRDDRIPGERVTPTGAAIVRHLCRPGQPAAGPLGRLAASGTGAGTRELKGAPNILRVTVYEQAEAMVQEVGVVAFDVDDMTGEEIGVACERLRGEAGVLDVAVGTLMGKKSRPLHRFEILVEPAHLEAIMAACFAQTSTIGLRWRTESRAVLPRTAGRRNGVRVKSVRRPDAQVTVKVESDDVAGASTLAARRRAAHRAELDDV